MSALLCGLMELIMRPLFWSFLISPRLCCPDITRFLSGLSKAGMPIMSFMIWLSLLLGTITLISIFWSMEDYFWLTLLIAILRLSLLMSLSCALEDILGSSALLCFWLSTFSVLSVNKDRFTRSGTWPERPESTPPFYLIANFWIILGIWSSSKFLVSSWWAGDCEVSRSDEF